jgi:hypothetical protein
MESERKVIWRCEGINFLSLKFTNLNRGEEKKYYKLREDSKG